MPKSNKSRCIVCNSIYTDDVDFQLTKKATLTSIQFFLKSKGISISTTSIARHRDNHFRTKERKASSKDPVKVARKTRAKSQTKDPTKSARKTEKIIKDTMIIGENAPEYREDTTKIARQEEILKELTEDIDIVREFMVIMSLQKERAERARDEEEETGAVLHTTGKAYEEYKKTLVDFHKITNGMDSIKHLRFAELSQMMIGLFAKQCLTDQTRKQLLELIKLFKPEYEESPEISILPTQNQIQ